MFNPYRRDFLYGLGASIGSLAFTSHARRVGRRRVAAGPDFPAGQGQALHLPLHGRGPVAHRHV